MGEKKIQSLPGSAAFVLLTPRSGTGRHTFFFFFEMPLVLHLAHRSGFASYKGNSVPEDKPPYFSMFRQTLDQFSVSSAVSADAVFLFVDVCLAQIIFQSFQIVLYGMSESLLQFCGTAWWEAPACPLKRF